MKEKALQVKEKWEEVDKKLQELLDRAAEELDAEDYDRVQEEVNKFYDTAEKQLENYFKVREMEIVDILAEKVPEFELPHRHYMFDGVRFKFRGRKYKIVEVR